MRKTAFIQTDVAINPSSSGSPLFNASGEVAGLNSLICSGSGGYMNVSFSMPINLAVDIARPLRPQGRVRRAYLGAQLQEMPPALAKSFGVLVVPVAPGGPAEQAWLMRGDTFAEKRAVDRVAFQAITTVSPITDGTAV